MNASFENWDFHLDNHTSGPSCQEYVSRAVQEPGIVCFCPSWVCWFSILKSIPSKIASASVPFTKNNNNDLI